MIFTLSSAVKDWLEELQQREESQNQENNEEVSSSADPSNDTKETTVRKVPTTQPYGKNFTHPRTRFYSSCFILPVFSHAILHITFFHSCDDPLSRNTLPLSLLPNMLGCRPSAVLVVLTYASGRRAFL